MTLIPAIARRRTLLKLLVVSAICLAGGVQAADGVLVLGRVSDDPRRHYEQLKPLLDYVVPRMHDVGIREGRILMAKDSQQMMSYLRRGKVDWVTETPGNGLLFGDRAGARTLLMTERGGLREYRSVIYTRRDSGITSLAQLRGRSIAFQSPSSTSAYLVPAMILRRHQLPMSLMVSPLESPQAGSVGYVFANTDTNVAAWVHKRLVHAGASSEMDWKRLQETSDAFARDFVALEVSEPFPRAMELVGAGLDPVIAARLKAVLLEASHDPKARDALQQFFQTTGFFEPDAGMRARLETLRRGARDVRESLE